MTTTPLVVAAAPPSAAPGWRHTAALIPLLSGGSCLALMYTVVSPVLGELSAHLATTADATLMAQLFMTMPSVGMMLGGIASAWAVGKVGARALLMASLGVFALAGSAGLVLDQATVLLGTRWLLGLAGAAIATSGTTLLAERFDEATRARYIGYASSAGAVTGLLSTLLAGAIASAWGWRAPFGLYLVAFVILVLAVVALSSSTTARMSPSATMARVALPWRRLLPIYLLCIPLYAAIFITTTQVPFLLRADGITNPSTQSWVLSMSSLWNAVGAALYGRVNIKVGGQRTFVVSLGLLAVGQAIIGLSHGALGSAAGCALAGLGAGLAVPHMPALVLGRVEGAERGRALGMMYSALFLGSFCSPLFISPMALAFGRHGAVLATASLLAVGCAAALWLWGVQRRPSNPGKRAR